MSDLRGHSVPGKIDSGSSRKIIGAAILAALIGTAGAYAYQSGALNAPAKVAQVVPDNDLPS